MQSREGTFIGTGGAELFYRVIAPASIPKGVVLALHGLGDHSGGLQNLTGHLAYNGYLVYAMDLRGHGNSTGKRGFIREWEEYTGDLHTFRQFVQSEVPDLPFFMIVHSLGGVIGLDYSIQHGEGITGLVVIAPAVSYELSLLEKVFVTLLGKLKPDYNIEKEGDPAILTGDPEVLARIKADTLRHNCATPGLGRGLMHAVARLSQQAKNINVHILLQYGLKDEVTPPKKIAEFYDRVGSKNKKKIEYAEMRHRPFDDIGREQFLKDLVGWMDNLC